MWREKGDTYNILSYVSQAGPHVTSSFFKIS